MSLQKIKGGLMLFDLFGEDVNFHIKGNRSHKSFFGLFNSLIILCIVASFSIKQYLAMKEYTQSVHQSDLKRKKLDGDFETSINNF